MPETSSSFLTDRIQQLLDQRQQHTDAIGVIDKTLEQINGLLGGVRPGRKPGPKPAAMLPAVEQAAKRGRRRQRFAISGEESVLAFVKEQGKPTSQEIERQWRAEGRKGRAAKALSKLTREKDLKRAPMKGRRGSRYMLA
ncbi:MAG: hypothetical protein NTU53_01320 [Planctomycetota bacterium]|nr:hypothetical protein [Planctomycetota bacterium]